MSDEQGFLKLENQLCFTVHACSREIVRLYRPLLDRLGLTYPQYLVMLTLWEEEELTVKELGERLFLDSGTLTPMLKRMESAGLVERRRSPEDERKVLVRLTGKGQALKDEAICIPKTLLTRSGMTEDEFRRMLRQFKDLLRRVQEWNRGSGELAEKG
jgi:DNA-binding MarR family transcriptional regulator